MYTNDYVSVTSALAYIRLVEVPLSSKIPSRSLNAWDFLSCLARFGNRSYSGHKTRAAAARRIRFEFGATIPICLDAARKRIRLSHARTLWGGSTIHMSGGAL